MVYVKDTKNKDLQKKIQDMQDNGNRVVNAKLYEKGNALIYELDKNNRELRFYKTYVTELETMIRDEIF